jgi:hypothetical protein
MKAIALAKRLTRDLNEISVNEPTSDSKQELLDAINGALQRLDAIAPFQSKTTLASLYLESAVTVSIGVTRGSTEITGATFSNDQYGRTVRIAGDDIDNQIAGINSLLHPYTGPTGTVSAVIYSDAVALPEPYVELVGDPIIIETGRCLCLFKNRNLTWHRKAISQPNSYWVESNAGNRSPVAPAIIRFDTMPDKAYRIQVGVILAPARVLFSDLLTSGPELPIREEHVELYLLPVARGILSTSILWRDADSKSSAREEAKLAEQKYEVLAPKSLATPNGRVTTKYGY